MRNGNVLLIAAISAALLFSATTATALPDRFVLGNGVWLSGAAGTCLNGTHGQTVQIPISITDISYTPLGSNPVIDPPRPIQGYRFRISFSPNSAVDVTKVTVSKAGIANLPSLEWSTTADAAAGTVSHVAVYSQTSAPLNLVAGVTALVAYINVPILMTAPGNINVAVDLDPTYTALTNEAKTITETKGSGDLAIAGSCIALPTAPPPCVPVAITSQPSSLVTPYYGYRQLTVGATGDAPIAAQWYRGTSGDTSSPVVGATQLGYWNYFTESASYWVRLSNACGTANSATATVTVYPPYKDVISLGGSKCVSPTGSTVWVPVMVRDVAQTVLGSDPSADGPIGGIRLTVRFSQPVAGLNIYWGQAVLPSTITYEDRYIDSSTIKYDLYWNEKTPPAFNSSPGVEIALIEVPVSGLSGRLDMTVDPPMGSGDRTALGYVDHPYVETVSIGNLAVENGCIAVPVSFSLSCPGTLMAGSSGNATITTPGRTTAMTANITSSNPSVATVPASVTIPIACSSPDTCPSVNTTFKITGVAQGTSTITVSIPTLASSKTCTVTVTKPAVALTPPSATATIGTNQTFTVSITPAQTTATTVTLASSNTTVATVPASVSVPAGSTATFNASAKAAGTATITATLPAALAGGKATATLTVVATCTAAAITGQPLNYTIASGASATLTVAATGTDLHYEWYEGAAPSTTRRVGTDSPSFTTPWLTATTTYWVRVKNSCSSVNSRTATVTVTGTCAPPAISRQPASVTIGIGESTTLTVAATGIAPLTYQWYRGTTPNVSAPVGSNAPAYATGALNTTTAYWVRVTSACGTSVDSATATVTAVCRKPLTTVARVVAEGHSGASYTVAWNAIGGVTNYEVQESRVRDFTSTESLKVVAGLSQTYTHTISGSSVAFFYRVRGIKDCDGSKADYSPIVAIVVEADAETASSSGQGQGTTASFGSTETRSVVVHLTSPSHKTTDPLDTNFVVTTSAPFLTASPKSGTIPAAGTNVVITAAAAGLPLGANTGTVRFTTPAGSSIASIPIWLSLVTPIEPTPRTAPTAATLVIPAVAHVDTPTTQFVSDVRIANVSTQAVSYLLSFTPSGINGLLDGKRTPFAIAAGQTVALDDVVKHWFGESANSGSLEIRPTSPTVTADATVATSRTYAKMQNGTYGQFIPAIAATEFAGKGHVLSLQHIAQSPTYRTNIGIVEGAGEAADVKIAVFNAAGTKLKEFALSPSLQPLEFRPINRILETQGVPVADGRLEISVTSATGKIAAYASVLDNRTEDPFCVTAVEPATIKATRYVVPGVADIRSGGMNWKTDLRIYNAATAAVTATLAFYPDDAPDRPVTKNATIAAGEIKVLDNILQSFFGVAPDRKGAVHVTTAAASSLVLTARTYFVSAAGTYGQFIPGVAATEGVAKGGASIQLLQLEESPRYRTNVGVTELSGNAAHVEVTAYIPGETCCKTVPLDLKPHQALQVSRILKQFSANDVYNARIAIRVTDGAGRVSAYASVVDAATSDPTYVPGQ